MRQLDSKRVKVRAGNASWDQQNDLFHTLLVKISHKISPGLRDYRNRFHLLMGGTATSHYKEVQWKGCEEFIDIFCNPPHLDVCSSWPMLADFTFLVSILLMKQCSSLDNKMIMITTTDTATEYIFFLNTVAGVVHITPQVPYDGGIFILIRDEETEMFRSLTGLATWMNLNWNSNSGILIATSINILLFHTAIPKYELCTHMLLWLSHAVSFTWKSLPSASSPLL